MKLGAVSMAVKRKAPSLVYGNLLPCVRHRDTEPELDCHKVVLLVGFARGYRIDAVEAKTAFPTVGFKGPKSALDSSPNALMKLGVMSPWWSVTRT